MADYISKYTGAQIDLSIASGSTPSGLITASKLVLGGASGSVDGITVKGDISSSGQTIYRKNTITNDDATPSVLNGTYFETGTNTDTITTFDGGAAGQIIHVISKAAITYDVTGTTLKCGTTDLVTADTDLTSWLYDGTNWICLGFTDQSDNLS